MASHWNHWKRRDETPAEARSARVNRGLRELIIFLGVELTDNQQRLEFAVTGQSGNPYTVVCRKGNDQGSGVLKWTCTCPDHQRSHRECKHIFFVHYRVLRLSFNEEKRDEKEGKEAKEAKEAKDRKDGKDGKKEKDENGEKDEKGTNSRNEAMAKGQEKDTVTEQTNKNGAEGLSVARVQTENTGMASSLTSPFNFDLEMVFHHLRLRLPQLQSVNREVSDARHGNWERVSRQRRLVPTQEELRGEYEQVKRLSPEVPAEITKLPSVPRKPFDDDCQFCLDSFSSEQIEQKERDTVFCERQCGRNFHRACFEQYLKAVRKHKCPNCRSEMTPRNLSLQTHAGQKRKTSFL